MFYEVEVKSHIRVPPREFSEDVKASVMKRLNEQFNGFVAKDLGIVVGVTEVVSIGEGVIIPGDGAAYYDTKFKMLVYRPELQEVVVGRVDEISDFGAFVNIGPIDGMVHIGQTMDDYVTFSKSNVLVGKESKRSLKVGDICRARIIALSFKDIANPKVGLTMRQHGLGKLEWLQEDKSKKREEKEPKKESEKERVREKKEKGEKHKG